MASEQLFTEKPTGSIIMIAASGPLRNLQAAGFCVSAEVANGTSLKTMADFKLFVHDWSAAPAAGGYFELHICYKLDGTLYMDGEDGDLNAPNLSAATLVGIFPIFAGDVAQLIQLTEVPLRPFDFKVVIVNRTSVNIPDADNSTLTIYLSSLEGQ